MKINKWFFISFGALALTAIVIVKFVLPNLGLFEMGRNLTSGDPERIAQAIDFESLRQSLLKQYQANKKRRGTTQAKTNTDAADAADDEENSAEAEAEGEAGSEEKDADASVDAAKGDEGDPGAGSGEPAEPIALPLPVENSTLGNVLDPLIPNDKRDDARVQAMLNDALSPDGINRLLNGQMTQYNDLAREVFPPHLVDMATNMRPEDVRALLQNVRSSPGPDGTKIMAVDMPNNGGELQVTLRQNGSSFQIVDLKVPQDNR